MSTAKIAISMDENHLKRLDYFIKCKVYKNRSQAIQHAIIYELQRLEHSRLALECDKLNAEEEQIMAEEGFEKSSFLL